MGEKCVCILFDIHPSINHNSKYNISPRQITMVNERKGTPVNGVRSTRRDNINDINDIDGNQTWRTSTEPAGTLRLCDLLPI